MTNRDFPIRLMIADDHGVFRTGLKVLIGEAEGIRVTGEAGDGATLLSLCRRELPDIVLMDIFMPELDGIGTTRYLKAHHPSVKVIALSVSDHEYSLLRMLEAGCSGYLLKNSPPEEIINAIRSVYSEQPYFASEITSKLTGWLSDPAARLDKFKIHNFSAIEEQIIRLICEEMTSKEISMRLHISKRSVDEHRKKIMQRIGARNTCGILSYAFRNGIYS